jgi:hypothetical protein
MTEISRIPTRSLERLCTLMRSRLMPSGPTTDGLKLIERETAGWRLIDALTARLLGMF